MEWVTTFPFNLNLYDPQYIGAVLSIWGFFFLFKLDNVPAVYLTICYCYMAFVEHREYTPAAPTDTTQEKKYYQEEVPEKKGRSRAQTDDMTIKVKSTQAGKKKDLTTAKNRKHKPNTAAY